MATVTIDRSSGTPLTEEAEKKFEYPGVPTYHCETIDSIDHLKPAISVIDEAVLQVDVHHHSVLWNKLEIDHERIPLRWTTTPTGCLISHLSAWWIVRRFACARRR